MTTSQFIKSKDGERPEDNVKKEKEKISSEKYIGIIETFKIIDEIYEKYLLDTSKTTDDLIMMIKSRLRVKYTSRKSLMKR